MYKNNTFCYIVAIFNPQRFDKAVDNGTTYLCCMITITFFTTEEGNYEENSAIYQFRSSHLSTLRNRYSDDRLYCRWCKSRVDHMQLTSTLRRLLLFIARM